MKIMELTPHSGQKSFYGKAKVISENGIVKLQSYETIVCKYDHYTGEFTRTWGGYSDTTMRHVNEFLHTLGIPGGGKKWWPSLPVER